MEFTIPWKKSIESLPISDPLYPYLLYEPRQVKQDLQRLKPSRKTKRAINAIGSAWKWLAGTPDHDHEVLQGKINEQLENTNKKVIINRLINKKITQIGNVTNTILKNIHNSEQLINENANILKYKI